jgi:hypothetical protein
MDFGAFSIGSATRRPPDVKGRLRTQLLQVMVKQGGDWKIVYHNLDVKSGVTAPEPQ